MAETAADMLFVAKFFDLLALHGVLGRRTMFNTSTSNASGGPSNDQFLLLQFPV